MSGYKVVPVEPTAEMVEAAQDAYMPFGDMDIALRMALLAAPAVQGELVAWVTAGNVDGQVVNGKPRRIWWENNEGVGIPIYTAPQPAEQLPAPDVAGLVEALEWLRGAINATPENDKVQAGTWISTSHPRIRQIDELLAAHRKPPC